MNNCRFIAFQLFSSNLNFTRNDSVPRNCLGENSKKASCFDLNGKRNLHVAALFGREGCLHFAGTCDSAEVVVNQRFYLRKFLIILSVLSLFTVVRKCFVCVCLRKL